jgi:HAD superfamily hydrolase (TIGR01549 family)
MQSLATFLENKSKQILVFDFDETIARIIIDWSGWHKGVAEIITQFDANHGYEPRKEHLSINKAIKTYGKLLREKLWEFNQSYELAHATGLQLNKPLLEFIRSNTDYRLMLYTSNSRALVEQYLAELHIDTAFERKCFRDDVALVKPDPDGFWGILHTESMPLEDYVMIGDSSSDEGMAKAVGIDFFKVEM